LTNGLVVEKVSDNGNANAAVQVLTHGFVDNEIPVPAVIDVTAPDAIAGTAKPAANTATRPATRAPTRARTFKPNITHLQIEKDNPNHQPRQPPPRPAPTPRDG
jgi:hypothetical protein